MIIRTHTDNRKALAKAISEYTGEPIKYMGLPTFAYQTGLYTIDRDGAIISETEDGYENLKQFLIELEYLEPELETFEFSVPINEMDGNALRNLVFMLKSKQYLLNQVIGCTNFTVSDRLILSLTNTSPADKIEFLALFEADSGPEENQGIAFDSEKVTFTFALSDNPDKNKAYTEVAAFMVARAKEAQRVNPLEQKPENEKYYLRAWLLRLGLTGDGGKASRKALLQDLKGHTAFRTPADAEKHKAKLLAKKVVAYDDEE